MNFKNIVFLLSLMLLSSTVYAASGSGTSALQFLNNDFSPRALSMGGAFVAVADDVYAAHYNPAGLGQIVYPELSASYYGGIDDSYLGGLHYGMLMPQVGFAKYARPAIGLSLITSSAGKMTLRTLDSVGSPDKEKEYKSAQQDYLFTLTYAEKFFVGDILLEKLRFEGIEQYYGLNVKYIRSTMLEKYTGNSIAMDMGYLLKHEKSGVSFGISLSNLGSGIKYIEKTEKMPTAAHAGLAWLLPTLYDQQLRISSQVDFHLGEDYAVFRLGAEYLFDKYISVRAGYIGHEDVPAMALGITLKYDDLSVDIAGTAGTELYNTTMASLSYRFSGLAYKKSVVKKRKFRGVADKVADPVGTKKQAPYTKEQQAAPAENKVAEPIMTPAHKEKNSTGNAGLFLIY